MAAKREGSTGRWANAAGMSGIRPGFCFAPEDDALFAVGWPHIRFVADGLREDEDAPAAAERILVGSDVPLRFTWPTRVAQGLVRAWGLPSIFELAPGVQDIRQEAQEALWQPDPLDPAEAQALLHTRMTKEIPGVSERAIETFTLLLEALLGAEVVGGLILEILETMPVDELLGEWTLPPTVSWQLGFLALRAPAEAAASWRGRMSKVLERVYEQHPAFKRRGFKGGGSHARSLHHVLHGGDAAEDSSNRALRWYAHVTDDPVLVRMRVAVNRLAYEPDARLVFLGGPDVLNRYAKDWDKLGTSEQQRWFFEQIAPIRAAEMYPLMLELAGRSLVREEARAWFAAHAADARPFLTEAAASDGNTATFARQVLKALG